MFRRPDISRDNSHASRRKPLRRLLLESLEDRSLLAPMADIINVAPDPRTTPVGQVVIIFDTSVTGVDIGDFSLTRDGTDVPLTGVPLSGSGDTYALDLANVTTVNGTYVLTLRAIGSGIADGSNDLLVNDALDQWVIDASSPAADIVDVSPDPRNSAVGNVTINFSEPVTGVDVNDFQLTRDGTNVSLAGLTVNGSGASYTLNLTSVTNASGAYFLTLIAANSGITDGGGNALAADATDSWTSDTGAPTADIVDIAPDPRNTAVGTVNINFSEPVTGVNIADFTLTRNGAVVALTGLTVGGSGAAYTLNLTSVTGAAGTYVLTLVAANSGIADLLGNSLAANAADTWVSDLTAPTANIVDVSPDPRTTPVGTVTIDFTENVTGVDINDFRLTRNGANVSLAGLVVNGSGEIYTLNLSSVTAVVGNYTLTLVATGSGIIDASGNALVANASDSWSIDDAAENNDTLATAAELGRLNGPITVGPLALVDNDWFRFTTSAKGGASHKAFITFQNALGNLDLELYSVSGRLLRSSRGSTNSESVSLSGLAAGTYFLRVFGKAGAINPEYSLTINAPRVLVDDGFEQNDTRTTASNFGTFVSAATITNLALLDGHDWYRFTTTTTGTSSNSVGINFQNSQGNLNLELFSASGTRLASSKGSTNRELISLAGRAAGTYYVHVLGNNGARNGNYSLTINPPSTAEFNIQFQFSGISASQISTFEQAAQKWQSVIVADVSSAVFSPASGTSVVVDDVLIDVGAFSIDGEGAILGGSAPDSFRAGSSLPYHGSIIFDKADLPSLQADGTLLSAAVHEIAHVLGFGTIWSNLGLLTGAGTSDPGFVGPQAVLAYNTIFGTSATSVPVESGGGDGTADSHWRESVLANELMTGFLGPGTINPLSPITVASMADLGYTVNLAAADPYTQPSATTLHAVSAPAGTSTQPQLKTSSAAVDAVLTNWLSMSGDLKKWLVRS